MQSASSIWSNLLSNATVNIIEIVQIAYFIPIRYQTWPPQTLLVSDWLISKKSSLL
jgi:hypothetical protein